MDFENLFDIGGNEREADQVKKHQKVSMRSLMNNFVTLTHIFLFVVVWGSSVICSRRTFQLYNIVPIAI